MLFTLNFILLLIVSFALLTSPLCCVCYFSGQLPLLYTCCLTGSGICWFPCCPVLTPQLHSSLFVGPFSNLFPSPYPRALLFGPIVLHSLLHPCVLLQGIVCPRMLSRPHPQCTFFPHNLYDYGFSSHTLTSVSLVTPIPSPGVGSNMFPIATPRTHHILSTRVVMP